MNTVRQEVALASAQELMNVKVLRLTLKYGIAQYLVSLESQRTVLYKMCNKAGRFFIKLRAGKNHYLIVHLQGLKFYPQTCLSRCLDRYMEACEYTTYEQVCILTTFSVSQHCEQNIHRQSKQRTSGRTADGAFSRGTVSRLRQNVSSQHNCYDYISIVSYAKLER